MKRACGFIRGTVGAGVVIALFFLLLEAIKACRSSQWSGFSSSDAAGQAAGWFLHGLVICIAIAAFRGLLRTLRLDRAALPAAMALAGGVWWALLSAYREVRPTTDDAAVAGGILVLALSLALFSRVSRLGFGAWFRLAGTAFLSGLAALYAASDVWLFHPDRTRYLTVVPLLWAVFVAVTGLFIWLYARRARHAYLVAVLILPAAVGIVPGVGDMPRPETDRPNVILVVSDAFRADRLGHVPTPNLDALAHDGMLFERAYALAPWTLPSMSGMFASEYPPGLAPHAEKPVWLAQIWRYGAQPGHATLPQVFKAGGYHTAAITSNALLWSVPGIMGGFDLRAESHPILLAQEGLFRCLPFLQNLIAAWFPSWDGLRPHNATEDMGHYVHTFLKRARRDPFFLYVHYIAPHAPCDPPRRYRTGGTEPWPFFYPYAGGERWHIPQEGLDLTQNESERAYVRSLYDGEIRYVDEWVGTLLRQLDTLGIRKHTCICFTSDHGEELWDHGSWGHGQALFEESVHVPLIVAGPGIEPGRIAEPVSGLDIAPTLAACAGLAPCFQWRGKDLRRAHDMGPRDIYLQGTNNRAWPNLFQSIVSGRWKVIREVNTGTLSLFDLTDDPNETRNLAPERPDVTAVMLTCLDAWLAGFPSSFPRDASGGSPSDTIEHMRSMGYL